MALAIMKILSGSDRVSESLTWKVTQFCLGRPLTADDATLMVNIHRQAQQGGGTWTAVVTAIVNSDLVRRARTERQ